MPASERSFHDALPPLLYPDSDFLISALFEDQPHHSRSAAFSERLLRWGRTTFVLSSIVWTEFAHVISRQNFRLHLAPAEAREVAPDRWTEPSVRERYLRRHIADLDQLLIDFATIEVPLDATIRRAAVELMARHALGSQDAVHLATAYAANAHDIASFDTSYRRVDGLTLWDDGAAAGGTA